MARARLPSVDDFLLNFLDATFLPMDPNDLLCMAWKWQRGDVSRHTGGNLAEALGRVTARTIVLPISTDMFFTVQDLRGGAGADPAASCASWIRPGAISACSVWTLATSSRSTAR